MQYNVSVVKCSTYNYSKLLTKIECAITLLGGIKRFIKKGEKILLKPNLLSPKSPEKACTTHPEFLRAIITVVKEAGAYPYVGDSPAIHSIEKVASVSGIKKICEQENVPIISFKNFIEIKNKDGKLVKSFKIAKAITEFDKIINIPKLKNHSLTMITVAVKNLFGLIPGIRKGQYHLRFQDPYRFSQMLIDLNMIIKPVITIVDGIVGMEGDGPAAGAPKRIGVIVAGTDTVSVDYICALIMNYNPDEIPIIKAAREANMGGFSAKMINLRGVKLEEVVSKNFKTLNPPASKGFISQIIGSISRNLIIKKPLINKQKCVGCAECVKVCPSHTITIKEKKANINYKNCIRCYCCFEICRFGAIKLTRF